MATVHHPIYSLHMVRKIPLSTSNMHAEPPSKDRISTTQTIQHEDVTYLLVSYHHWRALIGPFLVISTTAILVHAAANSTGTNTGKEDEGSLSRGCHSSLVT